MANKHPASYIKLREVKVSYVSHKAVKVYNSIELLACHKLYSSTLYRLLQEIKEKGCNDPIKTNHV